MNLSSQGNMGLRIIVFMGAATFLFLMLMAFGLKKSLQAPPGAPVPAGKATSPFSENRAWEDFERLVSLPHLRQDAPVSDDQMTFIETALRQARLKTREFPAKEPGAPKSAIAGIVEGNRPGILILCATLSTTSPEKNVMARHAADAAWLLEMARILGNRRDGRSIWLLFLDDEPLAVKPEGDHNSHAVVEALKQSGELTTVEAVLCVDGIGDRLLSIQFDAGAPGDIAEILRNTATRQGYGACFDRLPTHLRESDLPFRDAGIPALALVDSSPGYSRTEAASEPGDTSRESLRAVGDVIYHALAPLEGYLDGAGMRSDEH